VVKFKVLPKVHKFGYGDKTYYPGDIVELSNEQAVFYRTRGDILEEIKEPEPIKEAIMKPAPKTKPKGPGSKKK
jgi:hypothetical protein